MCQYIEVTWFIWKLSADKLIILLDRDRGGGGGDELVNRSYRDRAADDLGHRDVTRNLSREL